MIRGTRGPGLVLLSALAFALSFPSPLLPRGEGLFAFVFLLPALRGLRGAGLGRAALYGALFAIAGFGLTCGWIANYDPLAPLLVLPIIALFYAAAFAAIRYLDRSLPSWSWLAGGFAWVGLEYLRGLGFLGFPYGVLGYSQYAFGPLARSAAVAGVFGPSFLLVSLQLLAARVLEETEEGLGLGRGGAGSSSRELASPPSSRLRRAQGLGLLALLGATILGGGLAGAAAPKASGGSLRIGLVQPNLPTDRSGPAAFREALEVLVAESRELLASGAEVLVWPETAFVPSIAWHERKRSDPELYGLVREARDFMASSGAAFLVGNDQGEERLGPGGPYRVDFNAALSIPRGGGEPAVYRKTRLVPFSESFPYGRAFPRLALLLEERAGGFWEPGPGPASLPLGPTRAAVPICYEDGFGELVRAMTGPETGLLLPLVNDAWSRSEAAERQHLAMSAFRAIETGRPVARCTNSGITALVDGRGRILTELPPFTRGGLLVEVRLAEGRLEPYLALGDAFARACLGAALGALLALALGAARIGAAEGAANGVAKGAAKGARAGRGPGARWR